MTKGAPFTEMARFVFGGDPRRLSEMNDLFISYAYNAFYNKISGTSLDQWLPDKLDLCRELILSSVASGTIEEIEFEDGQVIDRQWITHHFDFDSFRVFGFLDDFAMPTARPAGSATRTHGFVENIQRRSTQAIYVVTASRRKWSTFRSGLLDPSSSRSFARMTMAYST